MINEKNKFLTVSWLSGLLSTEIFISTGEWGVPMPTMTTKISPFLQSQAVALVMILWQEILQFANVITSSYDYVFFHGIFFGVKTPASY